MSNELTLDEAIETAKDWVSVGITGYFPLSKLAVLVEAVEQMRPVVKAAGNYADGWSTESRNTLHNDLIDAIATYRIGREGRE